MEPHYKHNIILKWVKKQLMSNKKQTKKDLWKS